jgi:hypothetical protein
MPQWCRPLPPARSVLLGQRAEGREVTQGMVGIRQRAVVEGPQQLQRGLLGQPYLVVVDQLAVGWSHAVHLGADAWVGVGVGMGVFDAQVQRVGESSAGRRVRRRLDRQAWCHRLHRVEQHEPGRRFVSGPLEEGPQISQIPHPPRPGRPRRVELQRPSPRRRRLRHPGGRDQEMDLLVHGLQPVPAQWQVRSQHPGHLVSGAVFAVHHRRPVQPPRRCLPHHDGARQRRTLAPFPQPGQLLADRDRCAGVHTQLRQHGGHHGCLDVHAFPVGVLVPGRDAMRRGKLGKILVRCHRC